MDLDGLGVYPWLPATKILKKKKKPYKTPLGAILVPDMYSSGTCQVNQVRGRKLFINKEKITDTRKSSAGPFIVFMSPALEPASVHVRVSAGPPSPPHPQGCIGPIPSAALIRTIIKSHVNWCWSKHQLTLTLSSLRTSVHFSLCIPLNGGRTGIINLRHPGDESSVKERE